MIINLNLIGTYNLSSGRAIRINEIIDTIKFNKHIEIIIKKTKKNESFILENHQINKKLAMNKAIKKCFYHIGLFGSNKLNFQSKAIFFTLFAFF